MRAIATSTPAVPKAATSTASAAKVPAPTSAEGSVPAAETEQREAADSGLSSLADLYSADNVAMDISASGAAEVPAPASVKGSAPAAETERSAADSVPPPLPDLGSADNGAMDGLKKISGPGAAVVPGPASVERPAPAAGTGQNSARGSGPQPLADLDSSNNVAVGELKTGSGVAVVEDNEETEAAAHAEEVGERRLVSMNTETQGRILESIGGTGADKDKPGETSENSHASHFSAKDEIRESVERGTTEKTAEVFADSQTSISPSVVDATNDKVTEILDHGAGPPYFSAEGRGRADTSERELNAARSATKDDEIIDLAEQHEEIIDDWGPLVAPEYADDGADAGKDSAGSNEHVNVSDYQLDVSDYQMDVSDYQLDTAQGVSENGDHAHAHEQHRPTSEFADDWGPWHAPEYPDDADIGNDNFTEASGHGTRDPNGNADGHGRADPKAHKQSTAQVVSENGHPHAAECEQPSESADHAPKYSDGADVGQDSITEASEYDMAGPSSSAGGHGRADFNEHRLRTAQIISKNGQPHATEPYESSSEPADHWGPWHAPKYSDESDAGNDNLSVTPGYDAEVAPISPGGQDNTDMYGQGLGTAQAVSRKDKQNYSSKQHEPTSGFIDNWGPWHAGAADDVIAASTRSHGPSDGTSNPPNGQALGTAQSDWLIDLSQL